MVGVTHSKPVNAPLIEPMRDEDWPHVEAIYRAGIATGKATFETETPTREQWDTRHHSFSRLVARDVNSVLGWAALSPVSTRKVYAGVAEVSVYIAENARGQGLGERLLQALIESSEQNGIWTLQAGIFPENAASIRLHDFELAERSAQEAQSKNPDVSWVVYEANAGLPESTFLLFAPMTALKQLDKSLAQADPGSAPPRFPGETNLYIVRPDMSHVSKEFAAGDPGFWVRRTTP